MKNNGRQRFYLWDYLWWMGEKWKQARRTGRVDGEMMLSIYIFALLIFPNDCYYPAFSRCVGIVAMCRF